VVIIIMVRGSIAHDINNIKNSIAHDSIAHDIKNIAHEEMR